MKFQFNLQAPFFTTLLLLVFSLSCKTQQKQLFTDEAIVKSVISPNAMVVSAHPLATSVGVAILKKGGNAVDAAIAVQLALAVVYPRAGNLGGGGFMVYRDPQGKVTTLDYREQAPAAANRDMYLDSAGNVQSKRSLRGHLSAGVPGTPAGLYESFLKGSKLKNWSALVAPAISLAEKGFLITEREAKGLNDNQADFKTYNTQLPVFYRETPWKRGDLLKQPDLAATLRRMQKSGSAGFYEGKTAQLLVDEMKRGGGIMSLEDLKSYKPIWREPLKGTYRGHEIYTMAPPSSGGVVLLQVLKMLEPYPLNEYGQHSLQAGQLMVEAERRAFAERANNLGDPGYWKVPMEILLDSLHIAGLMKDYSPEKAGVSDTSQAKVYGKQESDQTTHLSIVDAYGGAASVTTTLNDNYGSLVVVGGAGFILNDEMDDFTSKVGVKNMYGSVTGPNNAIAPGKRMLSSMTPTIVTKDNQVFMVLGTPGGTTIPTSVIQCVVNMIDFQQSATQAVGAPRFHHQWFPDSITVEPKCFSPQVRASLIKQGYAFKPKSAIGAVEAILRKPNGFWEGAADPRGDDNAQGY